MADAPGVGLGLYLARTLTEQIGGQITVENHVSHILAKTGFNNRVEIARLILEDRSPD